MLRSYNAKWILANAFIFTFSTVLIVCVIAGGKRLGLTCEHCWIFLVDGFSNTHLKAKHSKGLFIYFSFFLDQPATQYMFLLCACVVVIGNGYRKRVMKKGSSVVLSKDLRWKSSVVKQRRVLDRHSLQATNVIKIAAEKVWYRK